MAVTVEKAMELMKGFAPEEFQYKKDYDNIGLILGNKSAHVTKILCCLDVTEKIINEALKLGCEMIISHHPMIFLPIDRITSDTVLGKKLLLAAENKIAIYAAHTNLDFVSNGINDYVATLLGLRNVKPLDPYIDAAQGLGRVGDLANKVFCSVLKGEVETALKDKYVRMIGEPYAQVKRIAVINGGAGGETSYVDMAVKEGADCIITADIKHHVAMYALENGLTVIEPQHYTMEHCYISRLVQVLKIEAKAHKSEVEVVQALTEEGPRF